MMRVASFSLAILLPFGLAYAQQANPPANICVELSSYLDANQKAGASKSAAAAAANAQQPRALGPETATAVEQADRRGASVPSGQDESQQTSGMSGPVTRQGPGAAGPQGNAQEATKSGSQNPKPDGQPGAQIARKPIETQKPAEPQAPPPSAEAVTKGREAAFAQNLDGCAGVVRGMRVAGVALPTPLIALAALKPELRALAQKGPAPGLPPIPPSGITQPGAETQSQPDSVAPQPGR